jgi:hypothetical protein
MAKVEQSDNLQQEKELSATHVRWKQTELTENVIKLALDMSVIARIAVSKFSKTN